MIKNKKGQMIMVNLLLFVMMLAVLVAMIPAMKSLLEIAQQSDSLNCAGYFVNGNPNNTLSYNATLQTNTLACISIRLYLPYIVMVVLIGGVTKLLANRASGDQGTSF